MDHGSSPSGAAPDLEFLIPSHDGPPVRCVGVDLSNALQRLARANGKKLIGLNFNGMKIGRLIMSAELIGCTFDGSVGELHGPSLSMCHFTNADMTGSRFGYVAYCTFHNAVLDRCGFGGDVRETDFSGASLRDAGAGSNKFIECIMEGASLVGMRARGTMFSHCRMRGADLSRVRFSDESRPCSFYGNDMRDTLWLGAEVELVSNSRDNDVAGADLRGLNMSTMRETVFQFFGIVLPWTLTFGKGVRLPTLFAPRWPLLYPGILLIHVWAYPRTSASLIAGAGIAWLTC